VLGVGRTATERRLEWASIAIHESSKYECSSIESGSQIFRASVRGRRDIGLQGFSPKLAKREIASLSGAADDARYFQISVPVQPGNSGGALVDEHGNVVGVVAAKLNARAALAESGSLPENVNYAVKSSFLLSFLESVPEVSAKLKTLITADRKFEDVVKSAQDTAVLVLVY
jgi:serine protease Do